MLNKRTHMLFYLSIGGVMVLLTALACNLPISGIGLSPEIDTETLAEALAGDLVDHRPEVYAFLGRPDAFDISVIEVEGTLVRMESWRYYQYGTQVDFVDGRALWVVELDPAPDGTLFAAWYDPLDFVDGITGTEAVNVVMTSSPTGFAPYRIDLATGGEDLAGGFALVGDQIIIGLVDDQVVYVETIALMPEGGAQ